MLLFISIDSIRREIKNKQKTLLKLNKILFKEEKCIDLCCHFMPLEN